jgi:ABC-type nickel/cobalt efflux system permease component RcnA
MTRSLRTIARALAAFLLQVVAASAQLAHRPFSVGGGEGGGGAEGGITGYFIAEQSRLTHLMAEQVHALHGNPLALWGLVALGLGYGVFHAAGPGHGKALIASYMMANERSLRRGAVMALLAALLQATVAVVLVGAAALILHATASQMSAAADWLTAASAAGVAAIGLWLSWRKGRALIAALRLRFERRRALASTPAFAGVAWSAPARTLSAAAYSAADPDAGPDLELCCAPDAAAISGPLSLRDAAGTVIAAGARPCSGAILILVFALAQGVFAAGIAATFAMALGVAATTGALAWMAVFAKSVAMRFASSQDTRAALVARTFEFAASLAVLAFGLMLLVGARGGV